MADLSTFTKFRETADITDVVWDIIDTGRIAANIHGVGTWTRRKLVEGAVGTGVHYEDLESFVAPDLDEFGAAAYLIYLRRCKRHGVEPAGPDS